MNPRESTETVFKLPIIDRIRKHKYSHLPPSIPKKFADKLIQFHGKPLAWWSGNLLAYLMRPNRELKLEIENFKKNLKISNHFVG